MKVAGAYFRNDYAARGGASGYGTTADDSALPFADQALIGILTPQPTLIYSEWATQTSDNSWTEQTPTVNYQAYAVSDQQLVAVANTTSSEVTTLCVLSPILTQMNVVKTAFEGTPFKYVKTEAVYAQLDTQNPPTIYFLYWLELRDASDPKIGPTSLVYTATLLGGVLSYVLQIPLTGASRGRPSTTFASAFSAQMAKSPLSIPATPAQQATTPAPSAPVATPVVSSPTVSPNLPAPIVIAPALPSPQAASAASANTKAVLLVALGATAAIGAYKFYESRRKA